LREYFLKRKAMRAATKTTPTTAPATIPITPPVPMLDPEELPAVELASEAVPEELDEADPDTITTVVLAEVEKAVSAS
jgi:hypothetical protein